MAQLLRSMMGGIILQTAKGQHIPPPLHSSRGTGSLGCLSPCLPHRTDTQPECVCDVRSRRLFNIVGSFVLLIGPYKADCIATTEKSFEELSVQIRRPLVPD